MPHAEPGFTWWQFRHHGEHAQPGTDGARFWWTLGYRAVNLRLARLPGPQ
jgi:hypothetical protein